MIRPMSLADLDAVLDIEQAVQHYPWTRGNFTDALKCEYVCSVDAQELVPRQPEQGVEIRGYAILMPLVDEAELLTIGVAPGQQRRGIGQGLLTWMLEEAKRRDMRCVFLEVRVSNQPAIALYQNAGFIRIGTRKDYYRDDDGCDDAYTMACDLTEKGHG